LSAIFRLSEAHRNEIRAQLASQPPAGGTTRLKGRNGDPRRLVAKQLLPYRFAWPQTGAAPSMSTIELVDPELRDALAQQLPPLTAESLTQRRASALELAGAVPKPDLPDIATDEIYVESAFGAKSIRVLTYRPVTSDAPLPVIVHIHGGGFVMGAPEMKDVENRLFAQN
jgi:acetyl esterase/lipase